MGIFKTIADSDIELYFDFRSGSLKDLSGNHVITPATGAVLNNRGLVLDAGVRLTLDTITLGTSDFSILTKQNPKGGINNYPLQIGLDRFCYYYGTDDLATYLNTHYYTAVNVGASDNTKELPIASTYDRDGFVNVYVEGLDVASPKDISADVAHNITGTGYIGKTTSVTSFNDYYLLVVKRVLTATEVSQLTAELESIKFPKKVVGRKATRQDGYVFNGVDDYGTFSTVNISYDKDWSFEYYWRYTGAGTDRVLLGNTATPTSYAGRTDTANKNFVIYNGTTAVSNTFGTDFIDEATYKIENSYSATTQIWTVTRTNLDTGIGSQTITTTLSTMGTWSIDFNLHGKRGNNNRYMVGNIYGLELTTDGTTHYITRDAIMNAPKPTHIFSKEINFKTDFGALANERAISTGQLENLPFTVESGSFKVVSDTYLGKDIKAIECITGGTFELKGGWGGTVWSIYTDTGAGYVNTDGTGIISSNVFTLTAGDKISLGTIKGDYGIIKR